MDVGSFGGAMQSMARFSTLTTLGIDFGKRNEWLYER